MTCEQDVNMQKSTFPSVAQNNARRQGKAKNQLWQSRYYEQTSMMDLNQLMEETSVQERYKEPMTRYSNLCLENSRQGPDGHSEQTSMKDLVRSIEETLMQEKVEELMTRCLKLRLENLRQDHIEKRATAAELNGYSGKERNSHEFSLKGDDDREMEPACVPRTENGRELDQSVAEEHTQTKTVALTSPDYLHKDTTPAKTATSTTQRSPVQGNTFAILIEEEVLLHYDCETELQHLSDFMRRGNKDKSLHSVGPDQTLAANHVPCTFESFEMKALPERKAPLPSTGRNGPPVRNAIIPCVSIVLQNAGKTKPVKTSEIRDVERAWPCIESKAEGQGTYHDIDIQPSTKPLSLTRGPTPALRCLLPSLNNGAIAKSSVQTENMSAVAKPSSSPDSSKGGLGIIAPRSTRSEFIEKGLDMVEPASIISPPHRPYNYATSPLPMTPPPSYVGPLAPETLVDRGRLKGLLDSSLLPIELNKELILQFMELVVSNTSKNIETCGLLAGTLIEAENRYRITHLIIPKQTGTGDTCNATDEHEVFDYQINHRILTIGWIHTHPTQACFLSSVDMHTQHSYQTLFAGALAVVVAPKETPIFSIFHLSKGGLKVMQSCNKKGFHYHGEVDLYRVCKHVLLVSDEAFTIKDLR